MRNGFAMIEGQPHITALIQGYQPTMNQAGAGAEGTGRAMAKGQPFNCVRGQGRVTLPQCLARFLGGHPVCARDCGCSLGKRAVEKNPTAEETMSYRDIYGDCECGKTHVKLDKNGRCYKCQEIAREIAKIEREERMLGDLWARKFSETAAPSIQAAQEPDDGQQVGPRVEEAGERLRGAVGGDEALPPATCRSWTEPGGPLVIDGISFEVVPSGKNTSTAHPVVTFRAAAVAFSADAVRKHGLDKYSYVRMHKAPGVVCFELLAEQLPNARKLHRQQKDAASLACTIHNIKDIFPGISGKHFDMEATERPGFFLARVG